MSDVSVAWLNNKRIKLFVVTIALQIASYL